MKRTVEARPAGGGRTATWRALGTYVHLSTAQESAMEPARHTAVRLLAEVDRTCSRFRQDSDLVRANDRAGSWTRVDPLLVEAINAAMIAAARTNGLVDPTLGHSLAAVRYDRDLALVLAASSDPPGSRSQPASARGRRSCLTRRAPSGFLAVAPWIWVRRPRPGLPT